MRRVPLWRASPAWALVCLLVVPATAQREEGLSSDGCPRFWPGVNITCPSEEPEYCYCAAGASQPCCLDRGIVETWTFQVRGPGEGWQGPLAFSPLSQTLHALSRYSAAAE
jgi:hypothetical protein